jgi:hypothetical protein
VRKATPPSARVHALAAYSIKRKAGKVDVVWTNYHDWRKPNASLRHATTGIARLLEREGHKRHKRQCELPGWDDMSYIDRDSERNSAVAPTFARHRHRL